MDSTGPGGRWVLASAGLSWQGRRSATRPRPGRRHPRCRAAEGQATGACSRWRAAGVGPRQKPITRFRARYRPAAASAAPSGTAHPGMPAGRLRSSRSQVPTGPGHPIGSGPGSATGFLASVRRWRGPRSNPGGRTGRRDRRRSKPSPGRPIASGRRRAFRCSGPEP